MPVKNLGSVITSQLPSSLSPKQYSSWLTGGRFSIHRPEVMKEAPPIGMCGISTSKRKGCVQLRGHHPSCSYESPDIHIPLKSFSPSQWLVWMLNIEPVESPYVLGKPFSLDITEMGNLQADTQDSTGLWAELHVVYTPTSLCLFGIEFHISPTPPQPAAGLLRSLIFG